MKMITSNFTSECRVFFSRRYKLLLPFEKYVTKSDKFIAICKKHADIILPVAAGGSWNGWYSLLAPYT